MAAAGESTSAVEIVRIARSITKAFSRFYNANAEFSKYYVKYENIDNYLNQNLDCSQQHPHLVELNKVIRCYLRDMKSELDSFRTEMDACCSLIKDKGHRGPELKARLKWVLKLRERVIALSEFFDDRKRFLEVTFGLKHGLIDMSLYLRETAQNLSKDQTTKILDKFAEFEATYMSGTSNLHGALAEERESRENLFNWLKKQIRPSRATDHSNSITPVSVEPELTSSVAGERITIDDNCVVEFIAQGDDDLIGQEEDIEQIFNQIPLPDGCTECDCEMGCICMDGVATFQPADINCSTSTPGSSDNEDDMPDYQDEEVVIVLGPDWSDDVYKEQTTNVDLLQTWREDIIEEINIFRSWLQEWPEDTDRVLEDDVAIISWLQQWPVEVSRLFSEDQAQRPGLALNVRTVTIALAPFFTRMVVEAIFPPLGMVLRQVPLG